MAAPIGDSALVFAGNLSELLGCRGGIQESPWAIRFRKASCSSWGVWLCWVPRYRARAHFASGKSSACGVDTSTESEEQAGAASRLHEGERSASLAQDG